MKADFSRLSFDALQHYVGVVHQQGRVWLDSDWNADVFERIRLLEQETIDIVGSCGVPKPHTGFKIEPTAAGAMDDFVIRGGPGSSGHYYVDGLLAELERDATYLTQPDYPDPQPLDPGDGRTSQHGVVFLEVWQRLITHLEDPKLRDIALGGPDTAGRLKTIAQVKVLPVPASGKAVTCEDADRLLAQTGGGTLTTLPPTDAPPDDDCEIPDPGSYTGRENRLYRVEVHDAGDVLGVGGGAFRVPLGADAAAGSLTLTLARALSSAEEASVARGVVTVIDDRGQRETLPVDRASGATVTLARGLEGRYRVADQGRLVGGAATFKWSRDNAGFASAVTSVADDRVTLSLDSLGRDVITTLRDGDLVEVSDDVSELGPARGHLTTLVADPEADPPRVTLAKPLPAEFAAPGGGRPDRHLKLRRWDGIGMAQAGFDPIATPDMNLGDGVQIQFGGADLRPGDYWTFAARRADGSVDRLDAAAPQGIVRHRCALAIVRWTSQVKYSLEVVVGVFRNADLGDVFVKLYAMLEALGSAGTKEIDEATILAMATEAGASETELERIRVALKEMEGTPSPRFEVVDDCRRPFDPLTDLSCACECTVAVEPGESIQAAIGRVPPDGGTVCLLPGTHDLTRPVAIRGQRAITIRGSGAATRVRAIGLSVAFHFQDCDMVAVRDLVVVGGPVAEVDVLAERRRRIIEALGEVSVQPEVWTAADAERYAFGSVGEGSEERTASATATALLAERATKPTAFPGLITFLDCRGTTVAGCSLLYAPPRGEQTETGFGLVFMDSDFLQGEMAPGVRMAMMAMHAAEAEAAPAPAGAEAESAPAPAPAAEPTAAAPEPAEAPVSAEALAEGEAPAPERPLVLESPALAGISALISAMGDRAPSIAMRVREPAAMRSAEAVSTETAEALVRAGRIVRDAERRAPIAAAPTEPAPTTERGTFAPLAETHEGLISILASIGRKAAEPEAAPSETTREVPVADRPITVLTGVLEQPVEEVPVAARPESGELASVASAATGVPVSEAPIRVETVIVEPTPDRTSNRRPVDLTVRDCRFFAGNGESGALVASAIGVTIVNDWFLPLADARHFGFDARLGGASLKREGQGYGMILVDDRVVTIRDNVIVDQTIGLAIVDDPTGESAVAEAPAAIQVSGNVIASRRGPALWAVSRDADLVLVDNSLTGEPTVGRQTMLGLAPLPEHGATADVTADTVIAIGNRFGCGMVRDAIPSHVVGMKASQIIFSSNLSVCDSVPGKANVVLRASLGLATHQSSRAGRITAASNLCREPIQVVRGDFRIRLEEVVRNLAIEEEHRVALTRIVAEIPSDDVLVTRLRNQSAELRLPPEVIELVDAAETEAPPEESMVALQKQLADLDAERSSLLTRYLASEATAADIQPTMERLTTNQLRLEERIRATNAVNTPPPLYSLVAIGAAAVTGMNILSHALLRSGAGSDVGSLQNTP